MLLPPVTWDYADKKGKAMILGGRSAFSATSAVCVYVHCVLCLRWIPFLPLLSVRAVRGSGGVSEFAFVTNQDGNINLFVPLYVNIRLKNRPRDAYSQRSRTYHTRCCVPAHAGRKGGGGHQETRSMLVRVGPPPTTLRGRDLVPGAAVCGTRTWEGI